ncbi:hypothetical protein D3C85_210800 [compost metagenome]
MHAYKLGALALPRSIAGHRAETQVARVHAGQFGFPCVGILAELLVSTTAHAELIGAVLVAHTRQFHLLDLVAGIAWPAALNRLPGPGDVRVILDIHAVEFIERGQRPGDAELLGHVLGAVGLRLRAVGDIKNRPRLITHQTDQAVLDGQLGKAASQRIVKPILGGAAVINGLVVILPGGVEYQVQTIPLIQVDVAVFIAQRLQHIEAPGHDAAGRYRRLPNPARANRQHAGCFPVDLAFRLRRQPITAANFHRHDSHAWVAGRSRLTQTAQAVPFRAIDPLGAAATTLGQALEPAFGSHRIGQFDPKGEALRISRVTIDVFRLNGPRPGNIHVAILELMRRVNLVFITFSTHADQPIEGHGVFDMRHLFRLWRARERPAIATLKTGWVKGDQTVYGLHRVEADPPRIHRARRREPVNRHNRGAKRRDPVAQAARADGGQARAEGQTNNRFAAVVVQGYLRRDFRRA